jgi:hypothetical protein
VRVLETMEEFGKRVCVSSGAFSPSPLNRACPGDSADRGQGVIGGLRSHYWDDWDGSGEVSRKPSSSTGKRAEVSCCFPFLVEATVCAGLNESSSSSSGL